MSPINPLKQGEIIKQRMKQYQSLARTVAHDDDMRQSYLRFKFSKVVPRARRALRRIEMGVYHLCENCGEEIGNRRLSAVPAATKCLFCQKDSEVSP